METSQAQKTLGRLSPSKNRMNAFNASYTAQWEGAGMEDWKQSMSSLNAMTMNVKQGIK
jgi:hypothetical protein